MPISRRNVMKLILPLTIVGSLFGGKEYIKYKKKKEIIKSGDLNDYVDPAKFMVSGKVANSPTESGWLNVIVSGKDDEYVLQQYFDFNDPSILLVRRKKENWSSWKTISNLSSLPKNGSKTVCLGDSITGSSNWPEKMQQRIGGTVLNLGISGTTISKNIGDFYFISLYKIAESINSGDWSEVISAGERLEKEELHLDFRKKILGLSEMDWNSVDYLVLFYGTNDFGKNVQIGNKGSTENNTVIGAMNYSIKMIVTKYPRIKIIFVSPMWRSRFLDGDGRESDLYPNNNGDYLIQYVDAIIETSLSNKIPCIDMYRGSGINKFNSKTFLDDGLHPTDAGVVRISEKISSSLLSSY